MNTPMAGSLAQSPIATLVFGETPSAATISARRVGLLNWAILIVLCSVAFAIYSHSWPQAPLTIPDTPTYTEMMPDLAHHHLTRLYARTPGLPLFLLLTGTAKTYLHMALLLHFLGVISIVFLMFRMGIRPIITWAFAIAAILPPFVQNAGYLGTESITESFLTIGFATICLFIIERHWIYCALSSFFFAGAALTRPTNVFTPYLLGALILLFLGKRYLRSVAVLVSLTTILVGSYVGYNASRFHYFGLSYATGFYLTAVNIDLFPDIQNPIVREELIKGRNAMYDAGMNPNDGIWRAKKPLEDRLGMNDVQLAQYLLKMNINLIVHHPQAYLEAMVRAATSYWFPYVSKLIGSTSARKLLWDAIEDLMITVFLLQIAVVAGVSVGMKILTKKFALIGNRTLMYLMALEIIFQTLVISCGVVGEGLPRYRSVTEVLILFALLLVADWAVSVRQATSSEAFGS